MQQSEIAREILTYLVNHPDAQDTLKGIVEWWLLEQKINQQTAIVKEALAELVDKGLIVESRKRDSRVHYRINPQKRGEIQALLKDKSPDTKRA